MKIEKSRKEFVCFELERAYNLAFSQEDDFAFFVNLMNYVELFNEFPELHSFVDSHIIPLAHKDRESLVKGENQFEEYLNSKFNKLVKYLTSNKVEDSEIKKHIEDYQLHRDGSIVSSNGKIPNMTFCLTRILFILWEKDGTSHRKHLGDYLSSTEGEYGNIRWAVFDERDKLEEIKVKYERHKLISIWYYWDKIAFQYNLFTEYEEMSKQSLEKKGMFEFWGIGEAYSDLMKSLELKEGKVEKPAYVEKHELKRALRQFHYHLIHAFEIGVEKEDIISKKIPVIGGSRFVLTENFSLKKGRKQGYGARAYELLSVSKKGMPMEDFIDRIWGINYTELEQKKKDLFVRRVKSLVKYNNEQTDTKTGEPLFYFDGTIISLNPHFIPPKTQRKLT
jgi:hypothetical protein